MRRVVHWVHQAYVYLVFAPLLGLLTAFFGAAAVGLTFVLPVRTVSRLCGRTWARLVAFWTPMRVEVEGRDNLDRSQSYVIVANHQSLYDVPVLYGWLDLDLRWVMKAELRRVPFLGAACARLGHVFVDRSSAQAATASLAAARSQITDGTSILFFPEGTRSENGELQVFKKGAFRMAISLGVPLLPVTVSGTRGILPSGTFRLRAGRARLVIHEPIAVDGFDGHHAAKLSAVARERIASALSRPDL